MVLGVGWISNFGGNVESTIIEDLMLLGMGIMSDVGRSVESKGVGIRQDSGTKKF